MTAEEEKNKKKIFIGNEQDDSDDDGEDVEDENSNNDNNKNNNEQSGNPQETLDIAWEVLELSRVIYEREKQNIELGEVYLTLGDFAMEAEDMEQAIVDYSNCLKLWEKELNGKDRRLAEVHYSLGLSNNFLQRNKEALFHYINAKKILEEHVNLLKSNNPTTSDIDNEITNVQDIIQELLVKIDEFTSPSPLAHQLLLQQQQQQQQSKGTQEQGFSKPTTSTSVPVNTLLNVRKKEVKIPQSTTTQTNTEQKIPVKRKIEEVNPNENIPK